AINDMPVARTASVLVIRFSPFLPIFVRRLTLQPAPGTIIRCSRSPAVPGLCIFQGSISDKMRARHSTVVCLWVRGNVIGEGKFMRQFSPDLPCNSLLQHGPRAMETCLDSFAPKAKKLCGFLHCQIVNHTGNQNASESLGKVFNRPFQNRVDLMLRDRALRIAVLE